jgi:hypothetical protein
VITDPLAFAGVPHVTVADVFPATATTESGTEGTAFTATAVEALEAKELPAALIAVTLNV